MMDQGADGSSTCVLHAPVIAGSRLSLAGFCGLPAERMLILRMPGLENVQTQCLEELYLLKVNSPSRTSKRLMVTKGWSLLLLVISLLPVVQLCVTPLGLHTLCFCYQPFS